MISNQICDCVHETVSGMCSQECLDVTLVPEDVVCLTLGARLMPLLDPLPSAAATVSASYNFQF